jgi:pyruvate dehydrogenase (quinone)
MGGRQRLEQKMSQTVAELLVGVLEQIGVKHVFGLIGDSLNPLADALRRSKIEWVGVRHEEGAALAAAGQAKLTGQLAVCAGTTGPGSSHLVAGLYEAARDHAPVLALSGDMARKLHGTENRCDDDQPRSFRHQSRTNPPSFAIRCPGVDAACATAGCRSACRRRAAFGLHGGPAGLNHAAKLPLRARLPTR